MNMDPGQRSDYSNGHMLSPYRCSETVRKVPTDNKSFLIGIFQGLNEAGASVVPAKSGSLVPARTGSLVPAKNGCVVSVSSCVVRIRCLHGVVVY